MIRDGDNGLLVEFFQSNEIADRVIAVLEDKDAFADLRKAARQTVVENDDLGTICLPAQLRLLERVAATPIR